ncbi:hypothetical protein NAP1_02480 [Erythrobacter sp. NAP1]|uniref:hypothetical protein n=1 Tax=Erythrobacter sp. NAP1 TaxID=237727 RepID=UPI0000686A6B|nr:hypothetical protein [Erythrobacter sp. NAP1]EAQ29602.1 hypothetical protein NAP1_02480 [Erythrobacter sp. NAP1]
MLDEPPVPVVIELPSPANTDEGLPTTTREDGSLVIDLTPLAPPPTECLDEIEPDPFNPEIIVCRETVLSPRIGPTYGPTAAELTEGSAIPRARVRLSEDAEAEANVIKKGVGGFDADGAEVRLKIDF